MLATTISCKVSVASRIAFVFAVALFALSAGPVLAQTTEFTYQGKLSDGGAPADGSYDFEFRLFDVETNGAPLGTQQRLNVTVTGGIFNVRLDFNMNFTGQPRWLEIAVKSAGAPDPFTTLNPRQPVTSAPYGIRSLTAGSADASADAAKLGGIDANQYVVTNDARLSDERPPTAGSTHYIQNGTAPQAASNFNITGNGVVGGNLSVAGTFSAPGQLVKSINGLKDNVTLAAGSNITITPLGNTLTIASTGGGGGSVNAILNQTSQQSSASFNIDGTGRANIFNAATHYQIGGNRVLSVAAGNTYAGINVGGNTTGNNNSFFGRDAGRSNTTASGNSFFGRSAGYDNTTGSINSFFGIDAGRFNTTGFANAFFGAAAGYDNTTGSFNSFVGNLAGGNNTTGGGNSFFGSNAGLVNTVGSGNAFFGSTAGQSNTTGNLNSFFGPAAGNSNTTGENNVFVGRQAGNMNTTGNRNTAVGAGANVGAADLTHATAIGAGAIVNASNTVQLGRGNGNDDVRVPGRLVLLTLGSAGSAHLCRNAANQLAACSSSLRYKTNIAPFRPGLNLVERLRPITFTWRDGSARDLGLGAEDVARVEPLLVTYNPEGRIEGVKYDRVAVVLLNAVREQQEQLQQQQQQIDEQQNIIDGLLKLVCQTNPQAQLCRK